MLSRFVSVLLFCVFAGISFWGCGGDSSTSPDSDEVRLTVKNELVDYNIRHIYIAWPETDRWGDDLLGERNLTPGKSVNFTVRKGVYDLKVVDSDNDAYIKRNVNLNKNFTWKVTLLDLSFESFFE